MTHTIQAVLASLEAYAEEHSVPIIRKSERKALIEAARKASPARILEVGTAIGYSSLLLLHEFPEAHIDTIEVDEQRYRIAEEAVEKAGVSHRWHGHLGDAARVIPTLEGPYDFVFLDGPKGQYLRELKMLEPLLTAHAVIAADNVLFRGLVMAEGQVPHRYRTLVMRLRDYIRYVNSAYDTIIDEEGDGLAVSVKR
ncbi:Predicted O-methyltransferase YrrM [Dialister histaminiformans]|uniref:Predicted O-methyltransferase YrrM n=1 Tax=Allisonella histaminiformans TaxID=209880 RepID=A0A1G5UUZ0_9FIRM|nr:O-methyltransferase [Allisonella histaminiformans]PWL44508.1 MAG: O-methyltransferase [Veillonellaceae bacterium]SDA37430.1 Predicted O-methyltransferase YrrM [Allisonella histaminiformans]